MDNLINGIILRSHNKVMGNICEVEILGKSCHAWVKAAFGNNRVVTLEADEDNLLEEIKERINEDLPYTIILHSDTPLVTKKTIYDACHALRINEENVVKIPRGLVIRGEYLAQIEEIEAADETIEEESDFMTAHNMKQVARICEILKNRILDYHMENGVYIEDVKSSFIEAEVVIGQNVKIGANTRIKGKTIIKNGVQMRNSMIDECIVDEGTLIDSSQLTKSFIGKGVMMGPFSTIRPLSVIGDNCRIGNFVEIKKSVIGKETKIAHLAYVGDAEVGEDCNIGCGVVFVNYDGKNKFTTKVGNKAFIGSNSNLVAPITIGDNAFIACGSTVTIDVPKRAMVIARERETVKEDWVKN
ncbi:MAG: hypothetical protein FWE22_00020 [Firmicutes bacterium]|nr:hypothetical protein [Bacillota bacterium]